MQYDTSVAAVAKVLLQTLKAKELMNKSKITVALFGYEICLRLEDDL